MSTIPTTGVFQRCFRGNTEGGGGRFFVSSGEETKNRPLPSFFIVEEINKKSYNKNSQENGSIR